MATIHIQNLKCRGCAHTVTKGVLSVQGADNVSVDVVESEVFFEAASDSVVASVKKKLAALGYPEATMDNHLIHKAKSYVSCAAGRLNKDISL